MTKSMTIKKIANANVDVKVSLIKGNPSLTIIVNDTFVHSFSHTRRESRMVLTTDINIVRDYFNGGTFVFGCIDGEEPILIDYRPSSYTGFIHSDDSFARMQEVIGVSVSSNSKNNSVLGGNNGNKNSLSSETLLMGEWSSFDLDVKALGQGGFFNNKLNYKYSLFSPNIVTSIETTRLICANGMTSTSPLITFEVPVINDWENNLHVVSAQLQPKINDILGKRFEEMANVRATVSECIAARDTLKLRAFSVEDMHELSHQVRKADYASLTSLSSHVDAERILENYYKEAVFKRPDRARLAESHLTQFDVYNVLTEASSHTNGCEASRKQLQVQANRIVYNNLRNKSRISPTVPESADSDHRRQFFRNS